jgi:hypothetical protein
MAFGRRKQREFDFKRASKERRKGEDSEPWFLADDDGPELEVETGKSSNLRPDDLRN